MSAIPSSPAPFDSSLPLPALARDKLMRAKRKRLPAYLYGAMGFGKTRTALAVTEGMKRCHITYHDDPNAACAYPVDDLLLETTDVLILDDLHRIRDRGTQKRILELLTGDVWIIFISRAALPSWLSHSLSLRPFVLIDESNFALGYEQICELMRKRHVDLPESVITLLQTQGEGNLSVVCWGLEWYAKGITRPSALLDIILELCVARIETELFEEWPPEILPFLARLSPAETFTLEMAEAVTGLPNAAALLQEARMAGSFLLENEQGMVLRNVVRSALWEYGVRTLGLAAMKEAAEKIGKYCEQENNLPAAIAMYKKSGS